MEEDKYIKVETEENIPDDSSQDLDDGPEYEPEMILEHHKIGSVDAEKSIQPDKGEIIWEEETDTTVEESEDS